MFCTKCGAQIEDGNQFCQACGMPVDQQPAPQAAPAQPVPPQAAPNAYAGNTAQMPPQNTTPPQNAYTLNQNPPAQKSGQAPVVVAIVIGAVAILISLAVLFVTDPLNLFGEKDAANQATASLSTNGSQSAASSSAESSSSSSSAATNSSEPAPVTTSGLYVLENSNSVYLTRSDISGLSNYELYLARNEIYARHGRDFKNADLKAYFAAQPWYEATYTPKEFDAKSESILNQYEKKNVQTILKLEKERGSSYLH